MEKPFCQTESKGGYRGGASLKRVAKKEKKERKKRETGLAKGDSALFDRRKVNYGHKSLDARGGGRVCGTQEKRVPWKVGRDKECRRTKKKSRPDYEVGRGLLGTKTEQKPQKSHTRNGGDRVLRCVRAAQKWKKTSDGSSQNEHSPV